MRRILLTTLAAALASLCVGGLATAGEPEPRAVFQAEYGDAQCVAFAPDGKTLAVGCGKDWLDDQGAVQLWDLTTSKLRDTIKDQSGRIACLAFTDGGKTLVSWSIGGAVKLYDPATGKTRAALEGGATGTRTVLGAGAAGTLTRDGKLTAVGNSLIETDGGKLKALFYWVDGADDKPDHVTAVAFSPDDRQLAQAGWNGIVTLWDVSHAKEPSEADAPVERLRGNRKWNERVAKFQFKLKGPIAQAWSAVYAPDGKTLAVGYEDGAVQLWDTMTGKARAPFRHDAPAKCVAYSPDGKTLAVGYEDNVAQVWGVETAKVRTVHRGHDGPVTGVAFAPDGKTLATAGGKDAKLWDVVASKTDQTPSR